MTRLRFVALATALVAASGLITAQSATAATDEWLDIEALGDRLGVCGSIHEAVLDLSPKTPDGQFDLEQMWAGLIDSGNWRLELPVPPDLGEFRAPRQPFGLHLLEYQGMLQMAVLPWATGEDDGPKILRPVRRHIRSALGRADIREPGMKIWPRGPYSFMLIEDETNGYTFFFISCIATEAAYSEALDAGGAAPTTEPAATEHAAASNTGDDGLGPNPWLDRSLVDVLLSFGTPDEVVPTSADNIVGLHYTMGMGEDDLPTEWWWWFIDGKAVYVAGDFLPPRGSKRARSSYQGFRKTVRGFFGEPADDGRDPETGTERVTYEMGPQLFSLTYLDPDGDPWFRIECFEPARRGELPDELRPNRKLPKRYLPPRKETDFTKEDLRGAVGAG